MQKTLFIKNKSNKEMHYGRNNYNVNLPESKEAMDDSLWHDGVLANAHQFSSKEDMSNEKFVDKDGKREVIFDKYGNVVTDPRDAGTYNYGPSDQGNKAYAVINHTIKDVIPYLIWGNTREESRMTNPIQRTLALGGIYF